MATATTNVRPAVISVSCRADSLTIAPLFPTRSRTAQPNLNPMLSVLAHARQVFCDIIFNDAARIYTLPVVIDSTACEAMNKNERTTSKTKNIEKRDLIHRYHRKCGYIEVFHINGDKYNLADIGTKPIAKDADFKISIMEHPVTDQSILLEAGAPAIIEEG
jgi:hypothetical protein